MPDRKQHDFLFTEYEFCFEQLRFYDTRHSDTLKYVFTLTSSVTAFQFAIYKFLEGPTREFYLCQAFLYSIVFIAVFLFFLMLLQNRLYFVFVARQINAIRDHLLKTEVRDFHANQLYRSINVSSFKFLSIHSFQLFGVASVSSLFAGVATFGWVAGAPCCYPIYWAILVSVVVLAGETTLGSLYLIRKGQKTADKAIHGDNPKVTTSGLK
jgi:hypothetical protein